LLLCQDVGVGRVKPYKTTAKTEWDRNRDWEGELCCCVRI
jgi:hypothetical protein